MFPRWLHPFARAPEGAEGGAAPADPAAGAPAADAPEPGSLFDVAGEEEAAPQPGADGKAQRPADVPEQFWDPEKGAIRTDAVMKSWRDLRAKVSKGIETPPEKPDAYVPPKVEGLPEGAIGGEKDSLWPAIQQAAHKAGISQKQLDAVATPLLAAVAEQMKQAAGGDPEAEAEAAREAAQEELGKLGPNGAAFVRDVGQWLKGMQAKGIFTGDELQALRGVSTAAGMRALGKLRELAGEKPIPVDAMQPEAATIDDLKRGLTDAIAKGDETKRGQIMRQLEEMERKGMLAA
jgi:hypothetical protein